MEFSVYVYQRASKPGWWAQWIDVDGMQKTRKLKARSEAAAHREGQRIEEELARGERTGQRTQWAVFRERWEAEILPGYRARTHPGILAALNDFEAIVKPRELQGIGYPQLCKFQAELIRRELAPSTIRTKLIWIRRVLRYALDCRLIPQLPENPANSVVKKSQVTSRTPMKGRPITVEEFQLLLNAIPKVIQAEYADGRKLDPDKNVPIEARVASWVHLLRGAWYTGLRLSELMAIRWNSGAIQLRTDCEPWQVYIEAGADKSGTARWGTLPQDAIEFLQLTPASDRFGFVFNPLNRIWSKSRPTADRVSKLVSKIGEAAGVVVDERNGRKKFASLHDLRRSFGTRWAGYMEAADLKELMRHASIQTTERHYIQRRAATIHARTAQVLADSQTRPVTEPSTEPLPKP